MNLRGGRGGRSFRPLPAPFLIITGKKRRPRPRPSGYPGPGGGGRATSPPLQDLPPIPSDSREPRGVLVGQISWEPFPANLVWCLGQVWGAKIGSWWALGGFLVGELGGRREAKNGGWAQFWLSCSPRMDYSGFQGLCLVALGDSPYPLSAFLPSPPPLSPAFLAPQNGDRRNFHAKLNRQRCSENSRAWACS